MIIVNVPLPDLGVIWPAIVVGVTVFFLVIVASTDLLSVVPANVYGYAACGVRAASAIGRARHRPVTESALTLLH